MNQDLESLFDIGEFELNSVNLQIDHDLETIYLDTESRLVVDTLSLETPISYLDTDTILNISIYSSTSTMIADLDESTVKEFFLSEEDTYSLKSFNTIKTNSSCTTLDAISIQSSECSITTVYNCSSQLSL